MSSLTVMLWSVGCVPVLTSPQDSADQSCWETVDNDFRITTPRLTGNNWFGIGETPPDMCMKDQSGRRLSGKYGQVVLLDISAEWCAPCQELATEVDHTWKELQTKGSCISQFDRRPQFSNPIG